MPLMLQKHPIFFDRLFKAAQARNKNILLKGLKFYLKLATEKRSSIYSSRAVGPLNRNCFWLTVGEEKNNWQPRLPVASGRKGSAVCVPLFPYRVAERIGALRNYHNIFFMVSTLIPLKNGLISLLHFPWSRQTCSISPWIDGVLTDGQHLMTRPAPLAT